MGRLAQLALGYLPRALPVGLVSHFKTEAMKPQRLLPIFLFAAITVSAQRFEVSSPNGSVTAIIDADTAFMLSIRMGNKALLPPSPIGLQVNGQWLDARMPMRSAGKAENRQPQYPVVPQKSSRVEDNYNEMRLAFGQKYVLVARAFDEGVAYRFETEFEGPAIEITEEKLQLRFPATDSIFFPEEEGFYSHNERLYIPSAIGGLQRGQLASLPALVRVSSGACMLITEANLKDYAGMWIRSMGSDGLEAVFPKYPEIEKAEGDRDVRVEKRAGYIARTTGSRPFPWRVFAIASTDAALLSNQMVYLLSDPPQGDFSWVRPGKVAWDWWNANNLYGVDFEAGLNTETYKYYIDFAAKYGLEYIILDEGWSKTDDLLSPNPDIDMPALFAYAKSKKVGIILWVLWNALDRQLEPALNQFTAWGAAGIKVDFMQRDDQKMVNYYWKIAEAAARHHMLVDFHGSYKPAGLHRTFPNVISREGVYGLEQSKWDPEKRISPEHNVTLPYIRMVAGPMDYTPGAMRNAQAGNWAPIFTRPSSLGTRCHQLAMYVVFESPLQMLADSPSNYLREPECMEFLAEVPTVWQQSIPLDGRVGDFIAIARQALNGDWYIGAMTDWSSRQLEISLDFLPEGQYQALIYQDGPNAGRFAEDFQQARREVSSGEKLVIPLAPGGGWVARLVKQ